MIATRGGLATIVVSPTHEVVATRGVLATIEVLAMHGVLATRGVRTTREVLVFTWTVGHACGDGPPWCGSPTCVLASHGGVAPLGDGRP